MNAITHIAARAPHLDPNNRAVAFLWREQARSRSRDQLIDNCIDHLMIECDMAERAAEDTTIQAYSDLECLNKTARIDLNATTAHAVVLLTAGGQRVMLTLTDLLDLLEQPRLATANKETGRLLVLAKPR